MATIGSVTKREDGRYEGELRTLSVRAEISIVPVIDKASLSGGIEVSAGWHRTGQTSGKEYVSLSISAPRWVPGRSTPISAGRRGNLIWTSTP